MAKKKSFFNRELSWLEFNQRVLDEAGDHDVPPLERLKFLAISAANLDEFFMVRLGGLKVMVNGGINTPDPSGMTPQEQIEAVTVRARRMMEDSQQMFLAGIEPLLEQNGIFRAAAADLSDAQKIHLKKYFDSEIAPALSPIALLPDRYGPLLAGQALHFVVRLALKDKESAPRMAVFRVHPEIQRLVPVPDRKTFRYILTEDIIKLFIKQLFIGEEVVECRTFRIIRNADLSVRDEFAADLIERMEEILDARKESDCVWFEIEQSATDITRSFLQKILNVTNDETVAVKGPLKFSDYFELPTQKEFQTLKYEPLPPHLYLGVEPGKSMFEVIAKQPLLLYHPFDGFDAVLKFLNESADDPDVISIKQTLYRTSGKSPVIDSLRRAAIAGKSVTAVIELKARFDEARNIEWARDLELDGVQVIYGVKRLKIHAKITMVTRRDPSGIVRYLHFGTGNYNEKTAALYTDISYFTSDEDKGMEAAAFFNAVTGYSQPLRNRKLVAAPIEMREAIMTLIRDETERKRHGQKALIMAKMNSLVCPKIIKALYEASTAGVKVMLNVRGVCCLIPGVKGMSENITVVSVVDRFLEHSRMFYFLHGGDEQMYISSADWMPRNLDRRVELMVPVDDNTCKNRLKDILETCMSDNVKARRLGSNGRYRLAKPQSGAPRIRSQYVLYERSREYSDALKPVVKTVFEPHMSDEVK